MLTTEDRLLIHDTYARYCLCLDTGAISAWAQLFTDDAEFGSMQTHKGREAIEAYGNKIWKELEDKPWTNKQHWNSNLVIAPKGKNAVGICYLLVVGRMKDSGDLKLLNQGGYQDDLVKVGSTWKFQRRQLITTPLTKDVIPPFA